MAAHSLYLPITCARPSVLAALMKLPVIYVFTHDSIAVGEDGPTHQPVEHLASLRCIPGLTVLRPADANETARAWKTTIEHTNGPVALILSRQNLPLLETTDAVSKGAYILSDTAGKPDIILISTGSEVHVTLEAKTLLAEKGVATRVVNMPSWELFEKTTPEYQTGVLPNDGTPRLAVEAASPMGWERYTGANGATVAMTGFGASAPGGLVLKKFGFTPENVAQKALALINK